MNRNQNEHFALNPTNIDISRSRFDRSCSVKTTFNVGDLIPFYVDEVLPGDTFSIDTSKVVRMQTPLTPIMDNIYLDTYYFFVPNRLVWEHWKELMGENTQSAWIPETTYSVPQITSPAETGWQIGTIADYMGIPTGVPGLSVNALPLRAYALICNDWFRSEVVTDPIYVPTDDATVAGTNGTDYKSDCAKGGMPFKAAKYFDLFTACLPSPQKGPDVTISVANGSFPVSGDGNALVLQGAYYDTASPPVFKNGIIGNVVSAAADVGSGSTNGLAQLRVASSASGNVPLPGALNSSFSTVNSKPSFVGLPTAEQLSAAGYASSGAIVSLQDVTVATVNQLRMAFQLQKLYEKDARGGSRYIEVLKSHFGVTSPDARLQRPEYLGGNRVPINVNQVLQQSSSDMANKEYLGSTGAYSLTSDVHSDFTKSFVEHGFVIGLMVARYDHTYQQGLSRMWSRRDRFDYYWPVLANIGEQAVLNREIYADGSEKDVEVFGYNEAWYDYRYRPSYVTGEMRSSAPQSLDVWHLADDYKALPSLSDSWLREDKSNVDRVLAVTSDLANQLFCDIYLKCDCTRPMPLYSIPGLIDHH